MLQPEHPPSQSRAYRTVTCLFGVFFVGLAVAIFIAAELSVGVWIAGFVIGGIGLDAVISAIRRRKSLLGRIGPLP